MSSNFIRTYRDHKFFFDHLEDSVIDIEDIAHALSQQCRWSGHTKFFYSVAQHSIHASEMVGNPYKLEALLHDAAEAYCLDMPTPLKKILPDYKTRIKKIEEFLAELYGVPFPMSEQVRHADAMMLRTEWDQLFTSPTDIPLVGPDVGYDIILESWSPRKAEEIFLQRYSELT